MASHSHHTNEEEYTGEIAPAQTKGIWRVFIVLCGLTAIEFAFAFLMDPSTLRNSIFIILTLFKAFFIVGEFMHLKHETKSLIWTILIPTSLLVWLLIALITEGTYFGDSVYNYLK
ncbi:cytochrome C oxidase subunit IV family protein [Adhaeribacter radiodurans]|uniref:Cytochrome C oxidase subunit IV family protein n=1 Tax=Adhaeribacter radiodurans TaxID=2745197 RepID=A0A7L7L4A7_9BACT|nr:cytochrome C oxidase subunit IV family protein [Adhaeribacter radiodurans]QMU27209.1 cytochrome C oxidase subunit IV family protein [Adhaeribacter radiodurans]